MTVLVLAAAACATALCGAKDDFKTALDERWSYRHAALVPKGSPQYVRAIASATCVTSTTGGDR
jgi:hypothetical protein